MNVWNELGSDEHFHDLKKFHLAYKNGTEHFFEGNIKLQKTWNGLIEILFGIQGKETSLQSKKDYWDKYATQRVQLITEQIEIYKPKLVVFYSVAFSNHWEQIINQVGGKKIVQNSSDTSISIFKSTTSTFAIIAHPVSIKMNGSTKRLIGETIKGKLK